MAHRGPFSGKCIGASIKGEHLEDVVWSDVSRFLVDPDELVDELLTESNDAGARAAAEAERDSLLAARNAPQSRIAAPAPSTSIPAPSSRRTSSTPWPRTWNGNSLALDDRLAVLEPEDDALDDAVSEDVLSEFRKRLEGGLSDAERQEIVQLLVRRITVHTTVPDRGRKQVRVVIDYRFPPGGAARTGIAASSSYNLRRVIAA